MSKTDNSLNIVAAAKAAVVAYDCQGRRRRFCLIAALFHQPAEFGFANAAALHESFGQSDDSGLVGEEAIAGAIDAL